jgi:hypothetical protein
MTTFLLFLFAVCAGAGAGVLLMALAVAGAKADLQLDALREHSRAALAHGVGDTMAAELALCLRRGDFGAASRKRIGDLLLRWGALRPEAATPADAA